MAYLEMTTKEFAKIVKSIAPNEIKKITGTPNGFSFEYDLDHGIPLLPSKIPLLVEFSNFSKDQLAFEVNINNSLFRRFAAIIIKKVLGSIDEEELPEGIYFEKNFIKIRLNQLKKYLNLSITNFSLENSTIEINAH